MKKIMVPLALLLVFTLLAGCAPAPAAPAPAAPAPAAPAPAAPAPVAPAPAAPAATGGVVKIGVVAAVTGTNKLAGEYAMNGVNLAVEQINAAGGILGNTLEVVVGDEVDNLQDSVNATSMLLSNKDLSAIIGSMYSQYCIAVLPGVTEAKIPYFAGGSSSGVSKEKNPYTWQVRPVDTFQGVTLANFAVNTLKIKNPAIMFSTQSTFASLSEQTVIALKDLGIEITDKNMFGFPEEETNYAPYFAQILAGDFDCIIAMSNQMPAALVCQQAEISGIDPTKIPCIGSTSYGSNVCITNAGAAADNWYSICDWVPGGSTEAGKKFEDAYVAKYGTPSDLPSVTYYDAIMLFKLACETAGTTTDREAINEALYKVKNYPGAISNFSYFEDHVFATSLGLTRNIDQKITMIDSVQFREP